MKIVMIHGQDHKGSTWHMAEVLAAQIRGEKEIEEFFLPRDLEHFCLGCYACLQDEKACPYWEDKQQIDRAMREADLLIFTTPTYCMLPSAPMKAFMDLFFTHWMSHRPCPEMFSKRAAVLSTAAGAGAGKAAKGIAEMLLYWGVPEIHVYGTAVSASCWEGIPEKKKAKILKKMQKLGRRLSAPTKPRTGLRTQALFGLMKRMQKAGMGAAPEEKAYWQAQGWLDGKKPWKTGS